ncbi:MAG: Crp/Fnr family transcriptional regulator [Terriglobales bacterium]
MATKRVIDLNRKAFFNRIGSRKTSREYHNNQEVFSQGEVAKSLFYVESGNVKLTVRSKGGKKAVIGILQPGDFFGECCLGSHAVRLSTATAIHPSIIVRITTATLTQVMHEHPSFATRFVSHLLFRLRRTEEDLIDQLFSSSEKRLARILCLLTKFDETSKLIPATLKLSQNTLAEMVGTTRARVSFFMNRFRKLGMIEYNGDLYVHRSLLAFALKA